MSVFKTNRISIEMKKHLLPAVSVIFVLLALCAPARTYSAPPPIVPSGAARCGGDVLRIEIIREEVHEWDDADEQCVLGMAYLSQDKTEAAKWFRKAADQGMRRHSVLWVLSAWKLTILKKV